MKIAPDQGPTIAAAEPTRPTQVVEEPGRAAMKHTVTKTVTPKEDKKEITSTETSRKQSVDEARDMEDTKAIAAGAPPSGIVSDQAKEVMSTATSTDKVDEGYYANQMNPKMMAQRVTGRITSVHGEPLIGANIMVRGTNLGTTSQLDGKFELYLPNGESEMDVVYGGYEDAALDVQPGQEEIDVQLKSISPATIDGALAGSSKKADRSSNAAPKMKTGTVQKDDNLLFIDYLKANSKYPLAENLMTSSKTVALEFTINSDGHPVQIKVSNSSGVKTLDDEAVRLIKKGPDWECETSQYPCKMRYSIYFKE